MRKIFCLLFFTCSLFVFSQSEQLAINYYDKGEFDKAISIFEEILAKQPANSIIFQKTIACYQQLQQYEKAEKAIKERMIKFKSPTLLVELGYNYQRMKNDKLANEKYNEAIEQVVIQSSNAYAVASTFEQKVLLDWAIKAYEVGKNGNPNLNFDYQIALLQGQLGNLELMVDKLLDYSFSNQNNTAMVQNQLVRFMAEDTQLSFNEYLKKSLLTRIQKTQDLYWNQFLSWYFVYQKDYAKAFIQEKAIYKRNPESFHNIVNLAKMAMQENEIETAKNIFSFILENTTDYGLQIQAYCYVISIEMDEKPKTEYAQIQLKIQDLIKKYGLSPYTVELQILSAHFDAFYMNQMENAKKTLTQTLNLQLSPRQVCEVKMELADILVFDEKFNQATLYYAQISEDLKNDIKSHEASMKMAKTTYYKQDFDWAMQQVKGLKQSPSLLIANDALELFLHIEDNSEEDSLRVALKDFARADLLRYQRKNDEALHAFQNILNLHKGNAIEDETLLEIGKIYESKKEYNTALTYYLNILDNHKESIYTDEALFYSAEIYRKYINDSEKAKALYEKMIFEHQDSIHFTESRKQYRLLRGDTNI